MAEQCHRAAAGIVKAADQIDQGRFAAAGTADHADGLAAAGRKRNIGQAGCARTAVGEIHMIKPDRLGSTLNRERRRAGVLHRGAGIQDLIYAHTAGQRARYRYD